MSCWWKLRLLRRPASMDFFARLESNLVFGLRGRGRGGGDEGGKGAGEDGGELHLELRSEGGCCSC